MPTKKYVVSFRALLRELKATPQEGVVRAVCILTASEYSVPMWIRSLQKWRCYASHPNPRLSSSPPPPLLSSLLPPLASAAPASVSPSSPPTPTPASSNPPAGHGRAAWSPHTMTKTMIKMTMRRRTKTRARNGKWAPPLLYIYMFDCPLRSFWVVMRSIKLHSSSWWSGAMTWAILLAMKFGFAQSHFLIESVWCLKFSRVFVS